MATYRIYFFGLVLHITDNGKGHSSVVWDDDHDATLMFGPGDEIDLKGIQSVSLVAPDLKARPAAPQSSFRTHVPSAAQILGGVLETQVAHGTGGGATHFHHVGGKLFAAKPYPFTARFLRDNGEVRPKGCVAALTLMLLNSDGPVTVEATGQEPRRLEPDSCLLIANFDHPDNHDPLKTPHTRKYSKLTEGSNQAITIEEFPSEQCPDLDVPVQPCRWISSIVRSKRGVETSAHTECGNNTWP